MGLNDKVLSQIRMMANGEVSKFNSQSDWAVNVDVKRIEPGARIRVSVRPGANVPDDPLLQLGDIADSIRGELRLERNRLGQQIYGTSESTFDTEGPPSFTFDVWLL